MAALTPTPQHSSALVKVPEQEAADIVHAIPGRLRLRVNRLKWDSTYAQQLSQHLLSWPVALKVMINPVAASLTLTYDPNPYPAEPTPPPALLAALQQICGLTIPIQTLDPLPVGPPASLPTSPFNLFDPQVAQTHLKTIGGGLIGSVAGDMVGGAVGATAGAIFLGPPGAILGSQIGVFVGTVVGSQIGAETVHQLDQLGQLASSHPNSLTPDKIAATIQKRAGEKIGETAGQAIGGVMGRVLLGPTGQMMGAIVGGAIGGQLGEDTASKAKPTTLIPPQSQSHTQSISAPADPHWLAKTTERFISETSAATIGSAVGTIVLGPAGQQLGFKLGNRISRIMEANAERIHTNPAAAPTPPEP